MLVTAFTAGVASAVASPAHQRNSLVILNQSSTATIYIAFDQPAVAAPTAGQITLGPIGPSGNQALNSVFALPGAPSAIPWQEINIIASAAATPVTILE